MKRKRGNKKGKQKGTPSVAAKAAVVNLVSPNREDSSGVDEYENNDKKNNHNKDEPESGMEVDTPPSSTGTDQPLNVASIKPDGSVDKTTGKAVRRVKVKLKTSKILESQSDTDKSSPQVGLEKQVTAEDSGSSLPEEKMGACGNVSKKPGSIKIKSSKVLGGVSFEQSGNTGPAQDKSLQRKELKTARQDSRYNKQELDSSLMVIKKVMKMDAAEPFNVPVNPEALGIPDYFDIIDTPMDFGTICENLEKGNKYQNSEDVYKDVQYIWDNCYKYNNKGDYILDLMRRVKKNFMKYWAVAGLYTEQPKGTNGLQGEDAAATSQGHVKTGQPKQKGKKRHGRRHSADCLCAICVLKRRKREREETARLAKGQSGFADNKFTQEYKQEESSFMESPGGEDSSSNMGESIEPDADVEMEEKGQEVKAEVTEQQYSPEEENREEEEVEEEDDNEEDREEDEENKMDIEKKKKGEASEQSEEPNQQSQHGLVENTGTAVQAYTESGQVLLEQDEETSQQRNKKELEEKQRKAKMLEKFHENPLLVSLCGTLFPENHKSVWRGPQSLFPRQRPVRSSSIHAAVEMLMK